MASFIVACVVQTKQTPVLVNLYEHHGQPPVMQAASFGTSRAQHHAGHNLGLDISQAERASAYDTSGAV
ncbi:hypothetical protein [Nitratidesulfovibrio liaohensis]|uniref:Uncharacterized protein n=1 Tax=Nitratidesulfovibrio liaohensis TaxID=2604158 RepID=A0ABY9R6I3_9BACT|nr:hypothetical protein [Nitratidesulfovibrio liaohensis]WMW66747.1 hypothetical protein KPS_001359 [Nitratidesulfovibrio liaohensis]